MTRLPRTVTLAAPATKPDPIACSFAQNCRRPHAASLPSDPSAPASTAGAWERRRHWYAPAAHRLLLQHIGAAGSSRFECSLSHAQHSYLWQHAVSGRSILPGAAMFEAAYAAAAALRPEDGQQQHCSLQGAGIAAPLLLAAPGAASLQLRIAVRLRDGSLQLSGSEAGSRHGGRPPTVLLAATAAAASEVRGGRQQAAEGPATSALAVQLAQRLQQSSDCAWAGQALGSLNAQPLQPCADAYHCHPAAVDAATHFGAAFDLVAASAPRVPVSLGCYTAGRSGPVQANLFAAASAANLQPDGSRLSSFSIAGALALGRLQSRPLGAAQQAAAAPAASAAAGRLASECRTYEVAWQAAAPQLISADSGIMPPPVLRLLSSNAQASLDASSSSSLSQMALSSYAAALRLLQALKPGTAQQLTAVTPSPQYGAPLGAPFGARLPSAGAAAVAGLLKVAALEEPAWRLQLQLTDRLAAQAGALPEADAYGSAAAAAASFVPRVQLTAAQPAASPQQQLPAGCHIVSGGTGGLGELTACHLAQQEQHASRLLLLGRTGRFGGTAAAALQWTLLSGPGIVTLLQADVAAAADAAATFAALHAPAASFIHTAGVLADKLLPSQGLADARRVFAPKLSGLAAALPTMRCQPMGQLLMFSSVSAALGNRGQANYAAANAALDGAAVALAVSGCSAASMQWGAWAGAGMATQSPQLLGRLKKQGKPACCLSLPP